MPDLRPARLLALAKHAVVFEVRLYRSLFRWVARRPELGSPGDAPVSYARTVTPVMWLWIFASAVEIPVIHLLVPWDGVRVALLAVGVWGLIWMVGLLASLSVYPHLLGTQTLRVRHGASHHITCRGTPSPRSHTGSAASTRRCGPFSRARRNAE